MRVVEFFKVGDTVKFILCLLLSNAPPFLKIMQGIFKCVQTFFRLLVFAISLTFVMNVQIFKIFGLVVEF